MHNWIVRQFNRTYYEAKATTWKDTYWLGQRVEKDPCDLWMYQELVWRIRPTVIVETGTMEGGSALYLATLLDIIGAGQVVSVDIAAKARPPHPRITYLEGSSTDPQIVEQIHALCETGTVLVILDSDHSEAHVFDELLAYADLVTPGSYIIVEDTNVNGHPVLRGHGPGPYEAVTRFLAVDPRYVVDLECEKHMLTHNPRGYLCRLAL